MRAAQFPSMRLVYVCFHVRSCWCVTFLLYGIATMSSHVFLSPPVFFLQINNNTLAPLQQGITDLVIPGLKYMQQVFSVKKVYDPAGYFRQPTQINAFFLQESARPCGDERKLLQLCFGSRYNLVIRQTESDYTANDIQRFFELLCNEEYSALHSEFGFDCTGQDSLRIRSVLVHACMFILHSSAGYFSISLSN